MVTRIIRMATSVSNIAVSHRLQQAGVWAGRHALRPISWGQVSSRGVAALVERPQVKLSVRQPTTTLLGGQFATSKEPTH